MLKFYIDENLSPALERPLHEVFREHQFRSTTRESLGGALDVPLFEELGRREFSAILTLDRAQLRDADERDALRSANLHWIGLTNPSGSGVAIIAGLASQLMSGLPHVLDEWREEPHIYQLAPLRSELIRPTMERI